MTKPVVLIDIDDTIAHTQLDLIEYANSKSVNHYSFSKITREFREANDLSYDRHATSFLMKPEKVFEVKPDPAAAKYMRLLYESGYSIHICSSRKENLFRATIEWLQKEGFWQYIDVSHTRSSSQKGPEYKVEVARKTNPVAAFDDTLDVIEALASVVPVLYMIDKPWNQTDKLPKNVTRSKDFAHAVATFLKIKRPIS